MFTHVYRADIRFREREAEITGAMLFPVNDLFELHEIDQGPVKTDGTLALSCARVSHGHGLGITFAEFPCLGYRLETDGRVLALSSDTVPCAGLAQLGSIPAECEKTL